jgi:hypothetical protein
VSALLAAELRKLWTVRTTWVLSLIGLGLVALTTSTLLFGDAALRAGGRVDQTTAAVEQLGNNFVLVLVVGLLIMTTEFRHATIGRTLQLEPSRTRVLVAKLSAGAVYATAFFLAALLLVAGLLALASALGDARLGVGASVGRAVWQGWVGMLLTGLLGVAAGALLRSQVVAITSSLLWLLVVENLAAALRPGLGRWLPFQALGALFLSPDARVAPPGIVGPLAPGVALAVFLGYVVAATALAGLLLTRRDV